jgi:beta-1,4-mannosyl-glycoprotein beta-1,4-N-acetylglucosaminyltransferase
MKIFDCFTYLDENLILDLRLNVLNKYVDKFVIVESKYRHNGEIKNQNFNIDNFSKFKDKIKYIYLENQPADIFKYQSNISEQEMVHNAYKRENYQRESIGLGLDDAGDNDFVLISDIDEIPNLENLNLKKISNSLIFFEQKMFYYKLNLFYSNFIWHGSKGCVKKKILSPQWLRNVKNKNYKWWRFDTFFSKKKYNNIMFVKNGGWHFTNIKKPKDIFKKFKTFLHHVDFEQSGLNLESIEHNIRNKKVGYDHLADQKKTNKWESEVILDKADYSILPSYIKENKKKYTEWLEL